MVNGPNDSTEGDEVVDLSDGAIEDGGPPLEYVHNLDNETLDGASAALDEVFASGDEEWEFLHGVEEGDLAERRGIPRGSPLIQELRHIIGYRLRVNDEGVHGASLGPRTRDDVPHPWPPRIRDKSDDVKRLWDDLVARSASVRTRARLYDLLFVGRHGNGRDRALSAVDAYVEDFESADSATHLSSTSLLRAWELSRAVGAGPKEAEIRLKVVEAAERAVNDGTGLGRLTPLLTAAAAWPRGRVANDARACDRELEDRVDELLDGALTAVRVGRFATEIVNIKKPRFEGDDELEVWRQREVEVYANDARAAEGFVKQAKLEEAVQLAKRYGLHDLAGELVAEMQRIPRAELRMARFASPFEVPMDIVERMLSGYTESADWREGFRCFFLSPPPSGDIDWLRRSARETRSRSLLSNLFPARMVNSARLPTWSASSEEDAELHAMALPSEISARFNGSVLAEGLVRIVDTYGLPSYADLVDYISHGGAANTQMADVLARAFLLFWREKYDACAHLVVPRIETAARLLLLELDVGVYNIHLGESPSGYPYLSSMLSELEDIALDPSWTYFLRWLLISPVGPNLRNEIAHGLTRPIGSVYAALLLRAATLLGTLTAPQGEGDEGWEGANLPPLSPRSRDDLIQILRNPIPDPIGFPITPVDGRLSGVAGLLRLVGRALLVVSHRLDGSSDRRT